MIAMADDKKIVICLSRDLTFFSHLTYFVDNGGFTHASLGLSEDAEFYYSFNFKGMKKEYRTSLKKRPREMTRYIVSVSNEAYQKLSDRIDEMLSHKERYAYAQAAVVKRLLSLPNEEQHDDRYFCSHFVAEVLRDSGCVDIGVLPANCTPNDLLKELEKSGQILYSEVEATIDNPVASFLDGASQKTGMAGAKVTGVLDSVGLKKSRDGDKASLSDKIGSVFESVAGTLEKGKDALETAPQKLAEKTSSIVKKGGELVEKAKWPGK